MVKHFQAQTFDQIANNFQLGVSWSARNAFDNVAKLVESLPAVAGTWSAIAAASISLAMSGETG